MADYVMMFGSFVFFVVFFMLFLTFVLYIMSFFFKDEKYQLGYHPNLTVAIPAYNEEKRIHLCLDSLKKNNYPKGKLEVLVIDDGSTDKTITIARKYAFVKVLRQKHKGKTFALNHALKYTKSDVLITIDADTVVDSDFLVNMAAPFSNDHIGATSGSLQVLNKGTVLSFFQGVEYQVNNLVRHNFSRVFKTGIWFFGSLAAYKVSALKKIGGFKTDTMAEDWDVVLEIKKIGYNIINITNARGNTIVPEKISELFSQRVRWWVGGTQALIKNRSLLTLKNPSLLYLFVHHMWWAFYAIISLPLIAYQVNYWMPAVTSEIPLYLFRWFSLVGPFYVLYKIPQWGVNIYNIFGVMSGVISLLLSLSAYLLYKERFGLKQAFALFFYFPYTVILNIFVMCSVFSFFRLKDAYFKK